MNMWVVSNSSPANIFCSQYNTIGEIIGIKYVLYVFTEEYPNILSFKDSINNINIFVCRLGVFALLFCFVGQNIHRNEVGRFPSIRFSDDLSQCFFFFRENFGDFVY